MQPLHTISSVDNCACTRTLFRRKFANRFAKFPETSKQSDVRARFFEAKDQVENKLLEMGLCLLEAQENPGLYPEYKNSKGNWTFDSVIQGEFGMPRQRGYQLLDFATLREKLSTRVDTFPETEKQARILAPYKNDDATLRERSSDDAIMERTKELTKGTFKLSAPALQDVVNNVTEKNSPELPPPGKPSPKPEPCESGIERELRENEERYQREEARITEEHRKSQEDIETARLAWEEMLKELLKNTGVNLNEKEAALSKLIIEAGYRAISKKIHPDAGGTHEDMVALNNAKDKLLFAIR